MQWLGSCRDAFVFWLLRISYDRTDVRAKGGDLHSFRPQSACGLERKFRWLAKLIHP